MDDGSWLPYLFIAVFILTAFYFAMAEAAFSAVSRTRIKLYQDKGDKRADKCMYILDHFDKAITTILIGTNIVQIGAASLATVIATQRWGLSAVAIASGIMTIVIFFLGEMLPKSIAKKYSESFSLALAGSLRLLMALFSPISFVLAAIGSGVAGLTKGDSEVTVTEDELYDIIENMREEGGIDAERSELVQSALMFADVTVESVLTSRVDLAALDIGDSPEEIVEYIRGQKHSRLPVYEGSVDNIVGILQIRKYLKAYLKSGADMDIKRLLDDAYFIHQSANIDEVLSAMSGKKINMAVVTDNYGGTLGIVTIEDILEELVGEIWDEDDEIVLSFVPMENGSFELDASLPVEEAFDLMGFEDPDEEDFNHKLMGEWAYEQFDLLPSEGDNFTYNGLEVVISQMKQQRIIKLVASAPSAETAEGGDAL